jgi:hypothetical protein
MNGRQFAILILEAEEAAEKVISKFEKEMTNGKPTRLDQPAVPAGHVRNGGNGNAGQPPQPAERPAPN